MLWSSERRKFLRRFCTALFLSTLHLFGPANGDHQGKKKREKILRKERWHTPYLMGGTGIGEPGKAIKNPEVALAQTISYGGTEISDPDEPIGLHSFLKQIITSFL